MRRSLEHILSCTLDTLNVSQETWKENQDKRTHQIFMVKQTFALIACEMEGYSRTEVGKFLGKHHDAEGADGHLSYASRYGR